MTANAMPFSAEAFPGLPPLAWLFLKSDGQPGRLLHGRSVDVRDDGFFEGCVAASDRDALASAVDVFGSGLTTRTGAWTFVTPSHTFEALYVYRRRDGWTVSNSIPFLAAFHGLVPPPSFDYGAMFASTCHGIDAYETDVFRTEDGTLHRFVFDNVEVSSDGAIRTIRKPPPPDFGTYDEYVGLLRETLRAVLDDGASARPARPAGPYRPIATVSSGYDAPCVAALAARLGCTEAVTLRTARGGGKDSGRAVAEQLGLTVHEVERPAPDDLDLDVLAEYFVTGTGGEDAVFRNFSPWMSRRVLLTGAHGDIVWDRRARRDEHLARAGCSGCSLQESRLWQDFVHVPVPTIGARNQPRIRSISRSAEMRPYGLGTRYDRPIPRRILEQAGVARSTFGQRKAAASMFVGDERGMLDAAAWGDLRDALPRSWSGTLRELPSARARWASRRRFADRTRKVPGGSALRRLAGVHWSTLGYGHPDVSLWFAASLAIMARRYRDALGRVVETPAAAPAR